MYIPNLVFSWVDEMSMVDKSSKPMKCHTATIVYKLFFLVFMIFEAPIALIFGSLVFSMLLLWRAMKHSLLLSFTNGRLV